jgi:hypothetical protein
MSWKTSVTAALVVGAIGFTAGKVYSQDKPKEMTEEEKMKMFMEMMSPTEEHKKLAAHAGTWDSEMTMYEPGKEPQKFKGVATSESVLNGLYVASTYKSNFDGMPFEGRGVDGYSKEKKKYFTFWYDSMGSTPMLLWGTADGKTITYDGDFYECAMGNHTPRIKITFEDADHSSMEYWMKPEGAPEYVKGMEAKYVRQGATKPEPK